MVPAFLLAAVRRFLNPESPLMIPDNLDWSALLELADAHEVIPLVYPCLSGFAIPASAAADLRSAFETSVRWSLAQSAELIRLTLFCNEHRIPFIALKGPLLSQ